MPLDLMSKISQNSLKLLANSCEFHIQYWHYLITTATKYNSIPSIYFLTSFIFLLRVIGCSSCVNTIPFGWQYLVKLEFVTYRERSRERERVGRCVQERGLRLLKTTRSKYLVWHIQFARHLLCYHYFHILKTNFSKFIFELLFILWFFPVGKEGLIHCTKVT